jgi:hypothetical protein
MFRRARTILALQTLLGAQNGFPPSHYGFVHRYSDSELRRMLTGWQVNQPALFSRHGHYVM